MAKKTKTMGSGLDPLLSAKAGRKRKARKAIKQRLAPLLAGAPSEAGVMDRLHTVVLGRREADPNVSHSARLLSRGITKVAQKFGEEAVECLIEAVAGNKDAVIAESADVLYHLVVLWVSCGVTPEQVWAELTRREGISGIAEKAARPKPLLAALKPGTSKIP
ncbi:MAG TPA: phosphoribosyl-ATP diphosphatase [Rhodopila sp.]|uniref:phosphoribosyl-ATP diphosphatase n=1 Tax=Rhodopila sp. TaxID=2480087 RepID=UPI002C93F1F0|nr:phosphoribosyl-ATP diphosphatase [Rhodopila sp.]HVY13706.1 phosphoribosyl-ATP diphosphatase [Rhodopila sp.]